MSVVLGPVVSFVWGSAVPLPPDLVPGWCYHSAPDDWLMVERLSDGSLYYVVCGGGVYELWPRVRAAVDMPEVGIAGGEWYADRAAGFPLPCMDRGAR